MKAVMTAGVAAMAVCLSAMPAAAQFGGLGGLGGLGGMAKVPGLGGVPGIPGLGGHSINSVDPDSFVAEAFETTRYMMTATALLAQAADKSASLAARRAYCESVQNARDLKELAVYKVQFQQDVDALAANKEATAAIQASYDEGDAQQKEMITTAKHNILLGILHNVVLFAKVPGLMNYLKTNPIQAMGKAGQITQAAELVTMEFRRIGPMASSFRTIHAAAGVEEPTDAKATKPRPIVFT